ncbi:hypothetical protein ATN83_3121 [Raoultella ornithinolytica]|nr:hypothetical protein ATN83_3121 [Raoultella ornithinolytica]
MAKDRQNAERRVDKISAGHRQILRPGSCPALTLNGPACQQAAARRYGAFRRSSSVKS